KKRVCRKRMVSLNSLASREIFLSTVIRQRTMSTPRNAKLAVGSAVLIGAFGFLVAGGMQSSTLRAMPVSELLSSETRSQTHVGQRLRVVGFVGDEPVRRVTDSSAQNDG